MKLTLKDRAEQMEKALAKAKKVRVPEDRLTGLNTAQDVLDTTRHWLNSREYMDLTNAELRTEEHNNLLKFIQWYMSWDGGDPEEAMDLRRVRDQVKTGADLKKISWLVRMKNDHIKSGKYDPKSNLTRNSADWDF